MLKVFVSCLFFILLLNTDFALSQLPEAAPVVVEEVTETTLNTPLTFVGAVEPNKKSLVASEISGLVDLYSAKEGEYVKKGEVLAKFNTKNIKIDLAEARAAKREAKARFNLANANFKRFEELYEKGIASLQELQDAESEREAGLARTVQLDAQINSQEYDLSRSVIKAPFDGFIVSEKSEVGQWITEGGPVAEMIDISVAKIKADIPERHISNINPGDEVDIKVDSLPDFEIKGEVNSIVPQANNEARTFPVEVKIDNNDFKLKSGMVARLSFSIGGSTTTKLVPKDAIVDRNNATLLFVVTDGVVNPVPVTTGQAYKNLIEVKGPIEKGQLVVTRGNERLRPEQPIRIVDSNRDAVKTQ